MITPERFQKNFVYLQTLIPTKPKVFCSDYPRNIDESFKFYLRQSAVDLFQSAAMAYSEEDWPLPMWFDPKNIKIGLINRLNLSKASFQKTKKQPLLDWFPPYDRIFKHIKRIPNNTPIWNYLLFPFFNKVFFKQDFSEGILEAFDCNLGDVEDKLKNNLHLSDKHKILSEVFGSYRRHLYSATVITLFPLLDHIARRFLKVTKLTKDVKQLCKLFESCGYGADNPEHLMYHTAMVHAMGKQMEEFGEFSGWESLNHIPKTHLGMVGPLLSSFVRFANDYYGYYKDEGASTNQFNRHGILHGSIFDFGSKKNAVKLITFFFLFLELEPVFKILLNEDEVVSIA